MEVTEVRITPGDCRTDRDGVAAYASICLDDEMVVHNVKLVRSAGRMLVCMPSDKGRVRCGCGCGVAWDSRYCQRCGNRMPAIPKPEKHHHDICHPLGNVARSKVEAAVLAAYAGWVAPVVEEVTVA